MGHLPCDLMLRRRHEKLQPKLLDPWSMPTVPRGASPPYKALRASGPQGREGQRVRKLPQPLRCTAAILVPAPAHTLAHTCHVPGWKLASEAPLSLVHGSCTRAPATIFIPRTSGSLTSCFPRALPPPRPLSDPDCYSPIPQPSGTSEPQFILIPKSPRTPSSPSSRYMSSRP